MDALSSLLVALPVLGAFALIAAVWQTVAPNIGKFFKASPHQLVRAGMRPHAPTIEAPPNRHGALEDILVSEGLATRRELGDIHESIPSRSTLSVLLERKRIDEHRFTSIWARVSGLVPTVVTPEDIDPELVDRWPETLAHRFHAMPVASNPKKGIAVAFVEPPDRQTIKAVEQLLGASISACLLPPTNLASIRDEIYPGRILGRRRIACEVLLDSLDTRTRRSVRETQMSLRCPLAEALERLSIVPHEELRQINALAHGSEPVDTSELTIGIPLLRTLSPLFCELHGILPLNNGGLAINHPLHPDTAARVRDILGDAATFQSDTPMAFAALWRDFTALRFSQDALVEHLLSVEILSIANAQRIREARRLLSEPVDRVLIRLSLATPRQIFHAIRSTSSLDIAGESLPPVDSIRDILAEDHRERSGIQPTQADATGVSFQTARLPSPEDSLEIMRRCNGVSWKFELSPTGRDRLVG